MVANKFKKMLSREDDTAEYIESQLKRLQREVRNATRELKEQQEANITIRKHFDELNKQHAILSEEVSNTSNKLTEATKEIEKANSEIQIFKPSVETKLINQIALKFEKELEGITKQISSEIGEFKKAKEIFEEQVKEAKHTNEEMKKLQEVIKKIDAKDFALEDYAKQLDKNDREKVKLMKRVDELESMLAKMKRR